MKSFLFTADMKLADLIHTDYRLLLTLSRFGVQLGFGDKTVEECCRNKQISTELFLMVCNVYTYQNYLPGIKDIERLDIEQLLNYLQKSHTYYLDNRIQAIQQQLQIIAAPLEPQHQKILNRFFEEYKNEVVHHFDYEEKTVFPYIQGLKNTQKSSGYHIEIFEQNHTNIDDKLNDLKNIIIKYLPGGDLHLMERTEVLFKIFSLEEDLSRHTLIEDKILIPLVQKLESRYEKQKTL